jgi:hypothetical protein
MVMNAAKRYDSGSECGVQASRFRRLLNAARETLTVGGPLKEFQEFACHANYRTTQRYIDANPEARS